MKKFSLEDKKIQEKDVFTKKDRKHCPDCCYYIDGVKMAHPETGNQMFSPIAGMRFVMWSTGSIYERLGTLMPCLCHTGKDIDEGYKEGGYVYRSQEPIAIYKNNMLCKSPKVNKIKGIN